MPLPHRAGASAVPSPPRAPGPNQPTYAWWLNWIEGDFAALRYVVLGGSDFTSHPEQAAAIGAYLRWRNRHAVPKRDFAPDSKIRHPDYTIKVA